MKNKSKGMTLIGMLFTVIIVIFLGLVVMRAVPIYIQHYSIMHSIKSLNKTSSSQLTGDSIVDERYLKDNVLKNLEINGIYNFKENNITVTSKGENRFQVKINYTVVKHLLYNINLLFNFSDSEEVTVGGEN